MPNNPLDQLKDVMAAPLGELISAIGKGVGEAQAALDEGSLHQTLALYQQGNDTELTKLLREIGYQPTFYVLPETEVEAQISLSFNMTTETNSNGSQPTAFKSQATAIPINAGNVNRFNLNGSSFAKIKFKIVPVPPPTAVTEMRVIPNLISGNLSIEAAIAVLESLGLAYSFPSGITIDNAALVKSQSPAAGTYGKLGDEILISPNV